MRSRSSGVVLGDHGMLRSNMVVVEVWSVTGVALDELRGWARVRGGFVGSEPGACGEALFVGVGRRDEESRKAGRAIKRGAFVSSR